MGMTQKTRIEPLPPKRANWLIRAMYRYTARRFGQVPEPFAVTAHHPRLLVANADHESMLQSASRRLPANVRELAVFWTARTIGCSWCVDYGYFEGMHDGIDPEKVRAASRWRECTLFDERERLVLEYAEVATGSPARVTDELAARLHAHFDEAEIVELAAWVALENFRSRFNAGLGLRSQGFAERCAVPPSAPSPPSDKVHDSART